MKINKINEDLKQIFSDFKHPFAFLYRPKIDNDNVEFFSGDITTHNTLDELPFEPSDSHQSQSQDVLALIPFKQVQERGFEFVDDESDLVAMKIKKHIKLEKKKIFKLIEDQSIYLEKEHYDINDEDYQDLVKTIISNEINSGSGANFVLKRTYLAEIKNYNIKKALFIFKKLLNMEMGAYWTFIISTGKRVLIGATPECHISLSNNVVTMNPISGTYRYPKSKPLLNDFLTFLKNPKEIEELYMVVDEELKMMSRVCHDNITLEGPYIRQMANLAHTEYFIKGKSNLPPQQILKETLFAPTVTGSPLESACRVIKKYEPEGRGYYSGVIALFGIDSNSNVTLDSSILIRTADISYKGKLQINVGSTIVRHSQPELESLETKAKANGLLKAINSTSNNSQITPRKTMLTNHPEVIKTLKIRNLFLSEFWLPNKKTRHQKQVLHKVKTLIIDAEDSFTSMLYQVLKSFGLHVDLKKYDEKINFNDYQLYILGPGPGDPRDNNDARVSTLKNIIKILIEEKKLFLAICLSHQILCQHLGLPISLRKKPNQGTQKEINLFGSIEKVGFYNSYSAIASENYHISEDSGLIEISKDFKTNEIHALKNKNFSSMQFHPESILTHRGVDIIERSLLNILTKNENSTHNNNLGN